MWHLAGCHFASWQDNTAITRNVDVTIKQNMTGFLKLMDDCKPNIIDDLIGLVGDKAVLQTTDDTASYLSDWHARFHGSAHAVVLPETTAVSYTHLTLPTILLV